MVRIIKSFLLGATIVACIWIVHDILNSPTPPGYQDTVTFPVPIKHHDYDEFPFWAF